MAKAITGQPATPPSTTEGSPPLVLVVGPAGTPPQADNARASADRVFYTALEAMSPVHGDHLDQHELVDLTSRRVPMEQVAWDLTASLVSLLRTRRYLTDDQVIPARRSIYAWIFWPIAQALALADEVKTRAGAEAVITTIGLSAIEARAFVGSEAGLPVGSCTTAGGAIARLRELLRATWLRFGRATQRISRQSPPSPHAERIRQLRRYARSARAAAGRAPTAYVVLRQPAHYRILKSCLDALSEQGWRHVLLDWSDDAALAHLSPEPFFASLHMGLNGFSADSGEVRSTAARRLRRPAGLRLVAEWTSANGLASYQDIIAATLAHILVTDQIRMDAHRACLEVLRPDVILCIDEISPLVEAVIPVARRLGIPTVNVQHGVIADTRLRREFAFDRFCVFGESSAEGLVRLGTPREQVAVVGNPGFDEGGPRSSEPRMDSGSVMTVVFAAQHRNALLSDWCLYRTLAVFLEWLEGARDCRAILKLHPLGAGREHGYELALSEHPELDIEVTREAALHDVLQGADCVASHSSTVLLDAAFLRVPAIVINPFGSDDYIPVVQEGTALRAEDAAGLARAVEAVRSGTAVAPGAYDEAIRRNAFVLDGRAGHRIAELCASLARH